MYNLVIAIQLISIVILVLECWVVFNNWKGAVHSYLFLACATMLVNNIGYLMELMSRTVNEYFIALNFSYFGRVWITYALLLFVAELVDIHVHKIIRLFLALFNVATYYIVLTTRLTGIYYGKYEYYVEDSFPVFTYEIGIWHVVWDVVLGIYALVGIFLLIRGLRNEKRKVARKRLYMVLLATVALSVFLAVEVTDLFSVTEYYDLTMLGFPISAIFIFIAIVRYRLLDTGALAKNYAIEELSEGVIAVDSEGKVSYFNKPAAAIFPAINSDPQAVVKILQGAIETGEPINLDDRIYTPEANFLYNNEAQVGTVYSVIDDTEHFRYMKELEEQKQIADNANKAKSSFLANMSHEIRTPINAVLGMDEMILRESTEKEIRNYAADIQMAGKTLLSLINDILDFSKIEEGKMEIIPTQYDLASVVNDLMNMVRDKAEKKGLELIIKVDENIPHLLYGDEIRIKQIALNLLTNAVKYTEKGTVTMNIGYAAKSDKEIYLIFEITDTGIGMRKEDMEKLFSPFARIEEKRNHAVEGTGLGMSIVQQLLTLMGSELNVKTEYGKGSDFSYKIVQKVINWEPVGNVASRIGKEADDIAPYKELFHAPDGKILVVDDTEVNLTVIKNLLKKTGLQIDTVSSGRSAIALAESTHYDIVLVDHMMPDMDGVETMNRLREGPSTEGTIYIVLTANAVSGAREMYLDAGFDAYLSKPVDGIRLEEIIKKYLPKEKVLSVEEPVDLYDANDDGIPDFLTFIKELDIEAGIANCGSRDSFLSVIEVFHQTAEVKANEIEDFWKKKDIENYTIKVHALKSAARIIGALTLSDMAKELEAAGKENNTLLIDERTEGLLDEYRGLDQQLKPLDDGKPDKKELTDAMRRDAFETMGEIAAGMDYGMMDQLMKDLKNYKLSPEDEDLLRKIDDMVLDFNWEGISSLVKEVLGR